jgi:hypothetical protein
VSHSKHDVSFCDAFDKIVARVGLRAFRSELEDVVAPAWKTIQKEINSSAALFFLVGKELVKRQGSPSQSWLHTQSWIAYEIGVACQKGIDVWSICDDVDINFPMPYVNNYLTVSVRHKSAFHYLRAVLKKYETGKSYPCSAPRLVRCPYEDCKMEFNLHVVLEKGMEIACPQCLRSMVFPGGHLLKDSD